MNSDNQRVVTIKVNQTFTHSDKIQITYNANAISGQDGTLLEVFVKRFVQNNLPQKLQIPGRIQAEAFSNQSGIVLEATTDNGGGQNIGYLAPGDFCEYEVNVRFGGIYDCLLYTSPSPRDATLSRMPSSA